LAALVILTGIAGCHPHSGVKAEALYQDAHLKLQQGDLLAASRESDAGYREFSGRNDEWAWRFRVLEAEVFVWRGLSADALQLLEPALPPALSSGDIAVRREMVRSLAYGFQQKFAEADEHLGLADHLARSNVPDLLGEIMLGRGTLEVLRGDPQAAEPAFRQSLQIAQRTNQRFLQAKALGSLGLVAMKQERYDESIDWNAQALSLSQSLGAETATEKILGNTGWSYYKMGDLDRALSLFTQAQQAAAQLGATTDEALWLTDIGNVEYDQRSYVAAERDYQQALALARKLENNASAANCLNNLAHVALMEKKYDLAGEYNRQAHALERENKDRSLELYSLVTESYIATGQKDFSRAEADLREVLRENTSDSYLRWQAEYALANLYVAENQPARAEEHFRKTLSTLETVRSSIQRADFRLSFLSGVIGFYDDYVDFLVAGRNVEAALRVAEVSRARTLAEGLEFNSEAVRFPIKDFHPLQLASQRNSIILTYWLGIDHSYVWVISPNRVSLFTLPPAAEIDPVVQSYRQALLGSRDVLETQNAAGRKLYDLLVAPAAKMVPKGTRVTILPDGSLYGLNFETLLAPSPQLHYWIEDVNVSYANSLTVLAAGASRHPALTKKLLLVGDPVSPDAEFPKLPQAAAEMTGIESYFPAAERTVYSGAEATPDSYLKSQPASFSYIHFVAHGTASRTSPLDSAVILSRQGDDYKLYARDIIQLPLHADLVTISACHGEGVRTYSGEGLVGLSWAFLRAGAHGVIAALWEVNDNSTPQLMDHLYFEIGKGVPPDAALRGAKLALLHSGGVYRRPFYWAPFELYRGS
jgi:CHAT domain-containing protein